MRIGVRPRALGAQTERVRRALVDPPGIETLGQSLVQKRVREDGILKRDTGVERQRSIERRAQAVDRKTGKGEPGPGVGIVAAARGSDLGEVGDDRRGEQRVHGEGCRHRHWSECAGASPGREREPAPEPRPGAEAEPMEKGPLPDGGSHLATTLSRKPTAFSTGRRPHALPVVHCAGRRGQRFCELPAPVSGW